jgi:hypothetical protein
VRSHLVQGLGPPADVLELSGSPDKRLNKLEVALWTPAGPTGPAVLISCGGSRVTLADGRRYEASLIMRPVPDKEGLASLAKILGRFGLFLATADRPVPMGTVIRAPDELAALTRMTALLVTPAINFPPAFRQLKKGDKVLCELVWLVPLHESEAQLVEQHGGEALMMQFTAYATDLAAWSREPIPRLVTVAEAKAMVATRASAPLATPPATPGPPMPAAPAEAAPAASIAPAASADPARKAERVAALKAEALARVASAASRGPLAAAAARAADKPDEAEPATTRAPVAKRAPPAVPRGKPGPTKT